MDYEHEVHGATTPILTRQRVLAILFLFASFLAFALVPGFLGSDRLALFPAASVALTTLYFFGVGLWPFVFLASLTACLFMGAPLAACIFLPLGQTIQASLGAYLLKNAKIDPLFRRVRDAFWVLGVLFLVSFILPSFVFIARLADPSYLGVSWMQSFVGLLFSLVVIVPFLLRWCAKPHFSRSWPEVVKLAIVFAILIGIDHLLFVRDVTAIGGIAMTYLLLIPLFWIALRKRPRFVTLAILITALYAIAGIFLGGDVPRSVRMEELFQIQVFIAVIASMFLIIAALEENRRLSTNLAKSQVAMLQNAVMRISSESKAKNDFIAILAHELRNPLAPIMSGIDLMKAKGGHDAEDAEMLAVMEGRMQVIRSLLDDLLDISRITEGKIEIRKIPVTLESIVQKAVLSTEHHFKERHQRFIVDMPEDTLTVIGDAVRLEQILTNLLTNASKYSDSGTTVSLSVTEKNGRAEIRIEDEGQGIDPANLEHIFIPFHQADEGPRSKKGLGIGLALVKSFAEMHGGEVIATSKGIGHGSQFTVMLPLTQSDASAHARPAKPKPAEHRADTGLSVLVVDDNDAAAWGIGRLLELSGCSVEYAYDGRHAIDIALKNAPDIILLDLGLPDQTGYDVAKTMRARGYRGRLIALTGFSTQEARDKVREAGFEGYLVKPAGLAELMKAIPELA